MRYITTLFLVLAMTFLIAESVSAKVNEQAQDYNAAQRK